MACTLNVFKFYVHVYACRCDVRVVVMCFAYALLHLESDMSNAVMLRLVLAFDDLNPNF